MPIVWVGIILTKFVSKKPLKSMIMNPWILEAFVFYLWSQAFMILVLPVALGLDYVSCPSQHIAK